MFEDWDVRIQASALIWTAFAAVSIVVVVADATESNDVPVIFLAALAAFLSTAAVWFFASAAASDGIAGKVFNAGTDDEKRKRGAGDDPRLELLLQLMDPDEKAALRRRVMDELHADGEAISLSELIDNDGEFRHLRQ